MQRDLPADGRGQGHTDEPCAPAGDGPETLSCPDAVLSILVHNWKVVRSAGTLPAAHALLSNLPVMPGSYAVETNETWMDWLQSPLFFQDP